MDREQVFLQPAFVLHQRPYRNTSVIVDIFSKDHGRIALIAKGVKQKKSALKSILQYFQPLNLSWMRRSDLGILTSAEFLHPMNSLQHENIYFGLYLNELLLRLLQPDEPMPDLFSAYADSLQHFDNASSNQIVLRLFEKQLLQSLGYEIPIEFDANSGDKIDCSKFYEFIPQHGFIQSTKDSTRGPVFTGEHLIALAENRLDDPEVQKMTHRLMHINLKLLLGDEPMKSRALFQAYKALEV